MKKDTVTLIGVVVVVGILALIFPILTIPFCAVGFFAGYKIAKDKRG